MGIIFYKFHLYHHLSVNAILFVNPLYRDLTHDHLELDVYLIPLYKQSYIISSLILGRKW